MKDQAAPALATTAPKLNRAGIGRLVTVILSNLVVAAIFFGAAGTLRAWRGWLYYGGLLAYLALAVVAMLVLAPDVADVVNERGKPFKKDVKTWDKVFGLLYSVLMLLAPLIAGLDGERFGWSAVPAALAVPAFVATILAYALVNWAMVVNKHAETGVRIQGDRGHQVCTRGPYRFVRHPFYVSIIVINLLYPLAIGSRWALVPGVVITILFIWRTSREDATLRAELTGYAEYAARVRYRLLPGVW